MGKEGEGLPEQETEPQETKPTSASFVFPDGAKYNGEFITVEGVRMRHGPGTYIDGKEEYQGEWNHDKMHGTGTYHFSSGAIYKGDFLDGAMHGSGTYTWADGGHYVGQFRKNVMHDPEGCYVDRDGVKWEGEFCNGKYFNGHTYLTLR